ncbi:MAG: DUF4145 domain-containing protein [Rhodanobacter sp.]
MKCPHCQVVFHDRSAVHQFATDVDAFWYVENRTCPACSRFVMELISKSKARIGGGGIVAGNELSRELIRPRTASRPRPPIQVPDEFVVDYVEASRIIGDSPRASAALSRRCLQHILREKAGVKRGDLASEIDHVLASSILPSHLAEAIDSVRNIGNFAAHPVKSTNSGELLPVEPGEAEWTLDTLDGLFDFFFVQPSLLQEKRAALNAKLTAAGKPPIKG